MVEDIELAEIIRNLALEQQNQIQSEIQLFLEAKGLNAIYHFTSISNLPGIFLHGILGREELEKRALKFEITDQLRSEPIVNGICCSFSKLNAYMFSKKITLGHQLALVKLAPVSEILLKIPFVCSPGNFGSQIHKRRILSWPEEYIGGRGLVNMFLNEFLRNKYKLDTNEPTDPQAEIIFLDSIPSSFIESISVPMQSKYSDRESMDKIIRAIPKGLLVETRDEKMFPALKWGDSDLGLEFSERKWNENWS